MKRTNKALITTGVLASALLAAQAQALPVINVSAEGGSAASAAESNFLAGLYPGSAVTETFDSFTASATPSTPITAAASTVGTFVQNTPGSGGLCERNGCNGLLILDSNTNSYANGGPGYSGRYAISDYNWLDSNDSRLMTFNVKPGYDAVGFYMTDPNDAGGNFSITTTDGTVTKDFGSVFAPNEPSGQVYYLSFSSNSNISNIVINSNASGDGYGIDNVTVGSVPEPGTLALMGLGLVGLGLAARRRANA